MLALVLWHFQLKTQTRVTKPYTEICKELNFSIVMMMLKQNERACCR